MDHRVLFQEPLKLFDGYLLGGDGKAAGNGLMSEDFRIEPIWLGRRWTYFELDRAIDHGERLTLVVDVPATLAALLQLHQHHIALLELPLLPPLPQGPLRRTVDAGIGVVAVAVKQLADQRLPLPWG